MATTTTNYGFDIPQSTDLVKDGATAIATLGQDIDTAMNTALGTKKAGMVLLNTTSFSGVAAQNFSSVFSNTYNFYLIKMKIASTTSGADLYMRFREGSTDKATSYYGSGFQTGAAGTSGVFGAVNNGTFFNIGQAFTDVDTNFLIIDVLRTATKGVFVSRCQESANSRQFSSGGVNTAMSSFDGFTIYASSGNVSGTAYIYGSNQ